MNVLERLENDYDKAEFLQKTLIAHATHDDFEGTDQDYTELRKYFLQNSNTQDLLPKWIHDNRNLDQFWDFIKQKFRTYAERRKFIWQETNPLLEFCEAQQNLPTDKEVLPAERSISEVLQSFSEADIYEYWQRALQRKTSDPEGAITLARTLLESVCKHILDEKKVIYHPDKTKLPELYKKVSEELNLSASQHTEEVFKQILGGCSGIINGLGTLRNKLGDAHGKGKIKVTPAPRHAELAVNLAGAMALYLIETYHASKH